MVAQSGQDHKAALDYLTREFQSIRWSLDDVRFAMFEKLIASHHKMLMVQMQQQEMQYKMQMAAMAQGQDGKGQPGPGTAPGASQFTQPGQAPTGASITRTISG